MIKNNDKYTLFLINIRFFLIYVHPFLICVRLSKHVISCCKFNDHIDYFLVFNIYIY